MPPPAQSVFRNRSFRLFYAGQAFSYVGDGLRLIAIPLLVYHLTGSALSIGITYALELGPFAVFSLLGGSLADRLNRRALMIVCDATRFVVMALFVLAVATHALTLAAVYAGIVVLSIAAAVFNGGQASSIPFLVGKERATGATSALLLVDQLSQTVLPPVGGALFALVGPLPALAANACTYLLSQASLVAIDTLGPAEPSGLPSLREIARDVGIGYRFAWSDAALRAFTAFSLILNFFGMMVGAVFIPFLKRDFGASDAVVGYALGLGAVGAMLGSWLAGRIPRRWPFGRVLIVAYACDGIAFVPVMLTHRLAVAVTFLAVTNACVLFEIAQIIGWRMRVIPEHLVGRVFGAVRFVVIIGTVPGALIGGYLADRYGARTPIVVSGIGYLATALLVAAVPAVRDESR
ncbi:MAG: MFS transporter [Candidatus Eremiobacteraeota bacterium]|nr:MFS transporter [Candidatus Eremiobacteraeota bacterium]